MPGAVFYDLLLTNGKFASPGITLSVAAGDILSVQEPADADLADPGGAVLQNGDIVVLFGEKFKVAAVAIYAGTIRFDGGISSQDVKLGAFIVTNGTDVYTLYTPLDGQGKFPDITAVDLVAANFGIKGLPVSEIDDDEVVTLFCFAAGTMVRTDSGSRDVAALRAGDHVWTLDGGHQALAWVGRRTVPATGEFAPVWFRAGTIGNRSDLLVSPQHRVLVRGWRAELVAGAPEVLVAARHLVDGDGIRICSGGMVTYVHLMFDRHHIVDSDGALTESLFIGDLAAPGLTDAQRNEVVALFPGLGATGARLMDRLARPVAARREAALLLS